MTKCWRHCNALMRKNFIVWMRTPACSCFEILAPVVLMAVLWIIRVQVPTTSVDASGLFAKKYPVYNTYRPVNGTWTYDNGWVDNILRPMMNYSDYTSRDTDDPA